MFQRQLKNLILLFVLFTLTACPTFATRRKSHRHSVRRATSTPAKRLDALQSSLRANGFSESEVVKIFADPTLHGFQPAVMYPGSGLTWAQYQAQIMQPESIARGKQFLAAHEATLANAQKRYGVDKEGIVAVARIETNLGNTNPRFIGVWPPQLVFYRQITSGSRKWQGAVKQFVAFHLYCKRNHRDYTKIRGSYAGAFGITQFMPASIADYAADGNDDGIIDLFNPDDAIASTAKFLSLHDWAQNPRKAITRYYGSCVGYPSTALAYAQALGLDLSKFPDSGACHPRSKRNKRHSTHRRRHR